MVSILGGFILTEDDQEMNLRKPTKKEVAVFGGGYVTGYLTRPLAERFVRAVVGTVITLFSGNKEQDESQINSARARKISG